MFIQCCVIRTVGKIGAKTVQCKSCEKTHGVLVNGLSKCFMTGIHLV